MKTFTARSICLSAVAVAILAMAQTAAAQDALPNKTFKIIVPFVAGTGLDITTRPIADGPTTPRSSSTVLSCVSDWD